MKNWYRLIPSGPITIGNLTPVGQNSGQIGCRWPPNGHHLAACLGLSKPHKLWGPFWHQSDRELYLVLPQTVYGLVAPGEKEPKMLYRMCWEEGAWQLQPEHRGDLGKQSVDMWGGRALIRGSSFQSFWQNKSIRNEPPAIKPLPWGVLTLSHNRRENFQVVDRGGFYAEMTTLMSPGWSILVAIHGEFTPPEQATLGAGHTPVRIQPVKSIHDDWLTQACPNATGAVLLTPGLWQHGKEKISHPIPDIGVDYYAAEPGIPWQTWRKVTHKTGVTQEVLTPGEWMTPPGAVYGFAPGTLEQSGPLLDEFHRDALGYGHLWLYKE